MAKAKAKRRKGGKKEFDRKVRKKPRVPGIEELDYIDYKDVALLRQFMSERAKIRARRVTGLSRQKQSEIAIAIKNAREMALLPYVSRGPEGRGGRDRGGRGRGGGGGR